MDNIGKEWMHDWNYLLCMISSCYFLIKGLATEKANMGGHGVFFFFFSIDSNIYKWFVLFNLYQKLS